MYQLPTMDRFWWVETVIMSLSLAFFSQKSGVKEILVETFD